MATIKLNLSLDKLRAINQTFENVGLIDSETREERVKNAMLSEVHIKLQKKQLDRFPNNKPFNYKLTYYHADALESWLINWLVVQEVQDHDYYLLLNVKNEINQKLA